jgi:DNA-binding XRE family transcriptional regulator
MGYVVKVNQLIAESGLKKSFIAEKMGIQYDTFRRKLNGDNDFKVNELFNLCKILNINILEVFQNEESGRV